MTCCYAVIFMYTTHCSLSLSSSLHTPLMAIIQLCVLPTVTWREDTVIPRGSVSVMRGGVVACVTSARFNITKWWDTLTHLSMPHTITTFRYYMLQLVDLLFKCLSLTISLLTCVLQFLPFSNPLPASLLLSLPRVKIVKSTWVHVVPIHVRMGVPVWNMGMAMHVSVLQATLTITVWLPLRLEWRELLVTMKVILL